MAHLVSSYPVVALIGPRESGETTLARTVLPDRPCCSLEESDAQERALRNPREFRHNSEENAALVAYWDPDRPPELGIGGGASGRSWEERAQGLVEWYGPFRLAWLEALCVWRTGGRRRASRRERRGGESAAGGGRRRRRERMRSGGGPRLVPVERIEQAILLVRGHKLMLDADLAVLYGVETKVLVQAVKRNLARFPSDFMFRLAKPALENLRAPIVTLSSLGRRGYPPYAFTEQGVAMLSSVLHSDRAVQVNLEVMRTFVKLRRLLATHADLARKLDAPERKYERQFKVVFDAIRELMTPPVVKPGRRIGFGTKVRARMLPTATAAAEGGTSNERRTLKLYP